MVPVLVVVGLGGGDGDDSELDVGARSEGLEGLAERLVGLVHLLVVGTEMALERGGEHREVESGEAVSGIVAFDEVLQVGEGL